MPNSYLLTYALHKTYLKLGDYSNNGHFKESTPGKQAWHGIAATRSVPRSGNMDIKDL